MDFLLDSFGDGRKFRVFSLMDHCSRQALAIEADTSISSKRVIRILNRTIQDRGKPTQNGFIERLNGTVGFPKKPTVRPY